MPLRVVTAAAIFDGHDVAIGIFRRILQSQGCEVIHLGHDRGAEEVGVLAAEGADAIDVLEVAGLLIRPDDAALVAAAAAADAVAVAHDHLAAGLQVRYQVK